MHTQDYLTTRILRSSEWHVAVLVGRVKQYDAARCIVCLEDLSKWYPLINVLIVSAVNFETFQGWELARSHSFQMTCIIECKLRHLRVIRVIIFL